MSGGAARPPECRDGLLRPRDQFVSAVLLLLSTVGGIYWWYAHGGGRGELIEIDSAAPREISFLVDINTAERPELAQLPGIGETLARRIVEQRRCGGPFSDAEDICRRVPGIGPKTLDRIQPYLVPLPPVAGAARESPTPPNTDRDAR